MKNHRLTTDVEREHYILQVGMQDAAKEIVSLFFSSKSDHLTGKEMTEITKERLCAACGAARLGRCDQNGKQIGTCVNHWSGLRPMSADIKKGDIAKALKNFGYSEE